MVGVNKQEVIYHAHTPLYCNVQIFENSVCEFSVNNGNPDYVNNSLCIH